MLSEKETKNPVPGAEGVPPAPGDAISAEPGVGARPTGPTPGKGGTPAAPGIVRPGILVPEVSRGRPRGWRGLLPRFGRSRESFPYDGAPDLRQADTIGYGGCNICFNACPAKFYLKDGRVIGITGNDEDPLWRGRVCPKVQSETQLFTNPHRLLYPLRRVGAR